MKIKNMMKNLLLAMVCFFTLTISLKATHIVGGEVNYTCLGGDLYEISLKVYRDCASGTAGYDNPAAISVFDANGNIVTTLYVNFAGATKLPPTINQTDPCVKIPTGVCVEVADYKTTVNLPSIPGGYTITYQRCCRNNSISNLVNPGNVGSTYTAKIPENPTCNSNPQFREFPPIFVCAGFDIQFDHSATDVDGDSLYYSLCSPLTSTSNPPNPNPPAAPPYTDVPFQAPYSVNDPLGGVPLSINPQTGALTGRADYVGQFVVGVCVSEYRNGVLISSLNRDFQFNVLNCEREVVASAIGFTTNCNNHTVQFFNNSLGGVSYLWNFGDLTTLADTNNTNNAVVTYTYPDTGTYIVTLIAFSGVDPACNDTLTNLATVVDTCGACNLTLSLSKNDADCNGVAGTSADTLWNPDYSLSGGPPDTCSLGGTSWSCGNIGGCGIIQGTAYGFLDYAWICGTDTIPTSFVYPPEPCSGGPGSWDLCVGGCTIKGMPFPSGGWYYVCPGGGGGPSLGDATVTPSGGTPPYTYTWNTTPIQTGPTATNLEPGTYVVTVTDASGSCVATDSVIIDGVGGVSISTSSTDITSCSATDGTATVTPSGGTGPYSYRWIPGDSTTATITGLAPGSYTVIVMDNDSCTASEIVQVNNPFSIPVSITDSANVSCSGGNDGSAIVTPGGGFAPYTYTWSAGLPSDSLVTGLTKGFYTVTVTDSAGCEGSTSVNITEPTPIILTLLSDSVNCNGGSDGKAIVVATGGTPGFNGYTYLWTPGSQATDTASGLISGSYSVLVTDSLGCDTSEAVVVYEPLPITLEPLDSSVTACVGGGNGIAIVDVSGGVALPFTYLWCDGQNTRVATGLPEGFCTITVTDNNGCVAIDSVEVVFPPGLALDTLIANASCAGANDGSITVSPSGGKPAYSYLWSNGDTTQTTFNLVAPGTYTVTVTDAIGCDSTITVNITEPSPLGVILTPSNVTCPGMSNGSIISSVTGGTQPYSYSWLPGGETTPNLTNIAGGTYDLTVTDMNGCDSTVSTTIIELPNNAIANFDTATVPLCEGLQVIFTNLSSGATTYLWDFGDGTTSTEANPTHIFAYGFSGTITLTAFDGGCSDTYTMTINAGLLEDHLVVTAPNVFTPNGDGLNDCFNVDLGGQIKNCSELTIFNRWGNKVFSDENGACWDGDNASAGTYFYIIKVNETTYKGSLTLLK
ncbi:MAG: gliding motility-associated C-terminal domain-containing protein [Vicingus serpentipes]|nr:gliding motility-associated C-terminal domain-containing protein [Vicingus serpentipes]